MMVRYLEVAMKKENNTVLLVIFFIIILLGIVYLPRLFRDNNDFDKYYEDLKNYKVNEYIPILVDDEQMAKKYLNDYINNIIKDLDATYDLIDLEYRNKRFSSIDDYKNYVYSLNLSKSDKVVKYSTYESGKYKYYDIYDSNNNHFIFKTLGVLQYKILFEEGD